MTCRRWFSAGVVLAFLGFLLMGNYLSPAAAFPPGAFPQPVQGIAPSASDLWNIQVVDTFPVYGGYGSLDLDSAGRPHISYSYGPYLDDLRYAHFDGFHWVTETVDWAGKVGTWSALEVDTQDHPHIAYRDSLEGNLRYAYHDGTAWLTTTVDSMDNVGWFISLALDTADRPHISYYDDSNWNLRYAYYDGEHWQIEIVDTMYQPGWYTSITVDEDDRPHIAYHDRVQGSLKYARRESVGWHVEVVDPSNYAGWYSSIALDSAGRPHIAYCTNYFPRALCDDLRYASYDGTAWVTTTVDSAGWTGGWSSLVLDAQDRPRIAYCHYWYSIEWSYCDQLRYASFDGTGLGLHQGWQIEVVDDFFQPGGFASLELDEYGQPHLSYFGSEWHTLRYALACTPVTAATIVGPGALVVGQVATYTATSLPPTATRPLTLTWDNGATGATAVYSWTLTGTQALTVTVANGCGEGTGSRTVRVLAGWPHSLFLPIITVEAPRSWPPERPGNP
jgi:hypothetical protein